MPTLIIPACAKLNLSLDALGRRPDGYHDLRTVMQSVSLADTVTLRQSGGQELTLRSNLAFLPGADKNLAAQAARIFAGHTGVSLEGLEISLDKRIPVCAGTAGGSSDAAAVLRGLDVWYDTRLPQGELLDLAGQVGSDVPFCLLGGTALAEGRGERLTPLPPLPPCWFVLCKPAFSISTPELFRQLDGVRLHLRPDTAGLVRALEAGDLDGVGQRVFNVFEQALSHRRLEAVEGIHNALVQAGALGASMTGSGPTVYGLFREEERAREARDLLRESWPDVFLAQNTDGPGEIRAEG